MEYIGSRSGALVKCAHSLTKLFLSRNNITDAGVQALCRILTVNQLEHLALADNKFGITQIPCVVIN